MSTPNHSSKMNAPITVPRDDHGVGAFYSLCGITTKCHFANVLYGLLIIAAKTTYPPHVAIPTHL